MTYRRIQFPKDCVDGLPYGVRGLCRNWKDGIFTGPRKRVVPVYVSKFVINTWFKAFLI